MLSDLLAPRAGAGNAHYDDLGPVCVYRAWVLPVDRAGSSIIGRHLISVQYVEQQVNRYNNHNSNNNNNKNYKNQSVYPLKFLKEIAPFDLRSRSWTVAGVLRFQNLPSPGVNFLNR